MPLSLVWCCVVISGRLVNGTASPEGWPNRGRSFCGVLRGNCERVPLPCCSTRKYGRMLFVRGWRGAAPLSDVAFWYRAGAGETTCHPRNASTRSAKAVYRCSAARRVPAGIRRAAEGEGGVVSQAPIPWVNFSARVVREKYVFQHSKSLPASRSRCCC